MAKLGLEFTPDIEPVDVKKKYAFDMSLDVEPVLAPKDSALGMEFSPEVEKPIQILPKEVKPEPLPFPLAWGKPEEEESTFEVGVSHLTAPTRELAAEKQLMVSLSAPKDVKNIELAFRAEAEGVPSRDLTEEEREYIRRKRDVSLAQEYPQDKIMEAFFQAVLPIKEGVPGIEEAYPFATAAGKLARFAGINWMTSGLIGAVNVGKEGMTYIGYVARIVGGNSAKMGLNFSLDTIIDESAKKFAGGDAANTEIAKKVIKDGIKGLFFGSIGSIPSAFIRLPSEAAYGYFSAKLEGAENKEAVIQAGMYTLFGLLNRKNLSPMYKAQIYRGHRQALIDQLIDSGKSPNKSTKLVDSFLKGKFFATKPKPVEDFNKIYKEAKKLKDMNKPLSEGTAKDLKGVEAKRKIQDRQIAKWQKNLFKNEALPVGADPDMNLQVNKGIETLARGRVMPEPKTRIEELSALAGRTKTKVAIDKTIELKNSLVSKTIRTEGICKSTFDGGAAGINTKMIFDPALAGQTAKKEGAEAITKHLTEIFKPIDISKASTKVYSVGKHNLTKSNATFIWASSFNPKNRRVLYNSGLTDTDIAEVGKFLSADEKKVVTDMFKFYDEYWTKVDATTKVLKGVGITKEKFYFPMNALHIEADPKNIQLGIAQQAGLIPMPMGFLEKRVGGKVTFENLDYFGSIYKDLIAKNNYINMAVPVRDIYRYAKDPKFMSAVAKFKGESFNKEIDQWLGDIAYGSDRQLAESLHTGFGKFFNFLRKGQVVKAIGFNLSSVAKATISGVQGARKIGVPAMIDGALHFAANPVGANRFINSKDIWMRQRWESIEQTLAQLIKPKGIAMTLGQKRFMQVVKKSPFYPMLVADKSTCDIVWLGAYRDVMNTGTIKGVPIPNIELPGMRETAAIRWAREVVRTTQPAADILNLPGLLKGGASTRMYLLFKNMLNQAVNLEYESFTKFANKPKTIKSGADLAGDLLGNIIIPGAIIGAISRHRAPDIKEFATDTVDQVIGGFPFISHLTKGWGALSPIDGLRDDYQGMIKTKDNLKKVDRAMKLMSGILRIPYPNVKRIVIGEPFGKGKPLPEPPAPVSFSAAERYIKYQRAKKRKPRVAKR